jgi:hypothetical protein
MRLRGPKALDDKGREERQEEELWIFRSFAAFAPVAVKKFFG